MNPSDEESKAAFEILKQKTKKLSVDEYYHEIFEKIRKDHDTIVKNKQGYNKIELKVEQSNELINVLENLRYQLPANFKKIQEQMAS